jgi:peptidoglycan/LPS O-acetylase OafA/YrhL
VLFPFFPRYRFTNPNTDQSIFVGHWSYLWAGLLGALYVAWKGMGSRFVLAAAINIGFAILVLGVSAVTSFVLPPKQQFFVILVGIPAVVAVQGTMMVNIVRNGYRRRGWRIRANE